MLLSRHADLALVYTAPDHAAGSNDLLEAIDIRPDRLVPVLRPDLVSGLQQGGYENDLPYVAYPSGVFFGRIMAERILPALDARTTALPRAETALTFAALEMAVAGVAVAWVPASLARVSIAQGGVCDLSAILPSCSLTIRAIRLRSIRSPAEEIIWQHILALQDAPHATE